MESKQESVASNNNQEFEKTLNFVLSLEGKPNGAIEKPISGKPTNIKPFESSIDVNVNRSSASWRLFQEKKGPEINSSSTSRFSFPEKNVSEDLPTNMPSSRFSYQEKRMPEDPPTNTSRFSFQERKVNDDPQKYAKLPIAVEKKQEEMFKPRYPSGVERNQEDQTRNRALPEKRTEEPAKGNNSSAFRTAREQLVC